MKKLKILEIIGDATLAGAPRHLLSLLENLDTKKFALMVITPPGPLTGEIRSIRKSIEIKIVPMRSKMDLSAIKEMRDIIKHLEPDVIHVHGTRGGVLGRLAAFSLKIPIIYTEHLWTKNYQMPSRIAQRVQLIGLWLLDMITDLNIAVSDAVKDFMLANQITRPEKVIVIYSGIMPAKKKANVLSNNKKYQLKSIGTLNEQKGMQYLIAAMPLVLREFPQTELEIIGDGYFKKNLSREIKEMKLAGKVKLSGFVKDIYGELEKTDIYVQPSLSESFGLAILQAMSVGLPVVATKTGGIPEVVTQGKTGILVEPKNSKELSRGVLELLRDPQKAQKMGKMAAEDAEIKFSLKDMISEIETVYQKIVQTG